MRRDAMDQKMARTMTWVMKSKMSTPGHTNNSTSIITISTTCNIKPNNSPHKTRPNLPVVTKAPISNLCRTVNTVPRMVTIIKRRMLQIPPIKRLNKAPNARNRAVMRMEIRINSHTIALMQRINMEPLTTHNKIVDSSNNSSKISSNKDLSLTIRLQALQTILRTDCISTWLTCWLICTMGSLPTNIGITTHRLQPFLMTKRRFRSKTGKKTLLSQLRLCNNCSRPRLKTSLAQSETSFKRMRRKTT